MKWNTLSYRQKVRLVGIGSIILLIVCYQYGFKQTWIVYTNYKENKIKAEQSVDYATLFPLLQSQEKKISNLINNNLSDSINSSKETLAFIGYFCKQNDLHLMEYLPMQIAENSNFNMATSQITVEGSYKNLLRLIYELENHQNFGRLCSASFKSSENPFNGEISLTSTFYLQNLIRKENEKNK